MQEAIEMMSVIAEILPAGTKLDKDDIEDLRTESWWYSPNGNDVHDINVIQNNRAVADITLFLIDFPTSLGYGKGLLDEFSFIEWEQAYGGDLLSRDDLADLAAVAKALLNRRSANKKEPVKAVRFLMAWGTTTTEGGWVGLDYWEPPETTAAMIGWLHITKEGMAIVPIEELIEESKRPLPEIAPKEENNL